MFEKWLNLRACSDQHQGLYIGECKAQGKNAESLLTSEKNGTSTRGVTTCLTIFMLLLVGCAGVDLDCERYSLDPSGLREDAIQSSWMHGTALAMEERHLYQRGRDETLKVSVIRKRQRDETDKPYMGVGRCLESGGGVGTLPPNLKFRKPLKSAT